MAEEILYKFRDWNDELHKTILTKRQIYFTSPSKFNDPFDCKIIPRYDLMTKQQINKMLIDHILHYNASLPRNKIQAEKRKLFPLSQYFKTKEFLKRANEIMELNVKPHGIFSTSKTKEHILLWSHYANGHQGFCIGFDKNKLIKDIEVTYFETIKIVSFSDDIKYFPDYPFVDPM